MEKHEYEYDANTRMHSRFPYSRFTSAQQRKCLSDWYTKLLWPPAKKGPRKKDAATYGTIVPVHTRRLVHEDWHNGTGTREAKHGRTHIDRLQRLVDTVIRYVWAIKERDEKRRTQERELQQVVQKIESQHFATV